MSYYGKHNVYLAPEQMPRLKRLASKGTVKIAEHIRRAIDEYLDRQEGKS